MIKSENFIVVHGWMINELRLKGNELLIYSCIFGFTQDEENWFTGSVQYLADWCNSSRQTVHTALKSLVEKGFLLKHERFVNNVKFCDYRAVIPSKETLQGIKNFDTGVSKNFTTGYKKILHHNIDSKNIESNNKDIYTVVIEYLNQRANKKYRSDTPKTRQLIKMRLKEGFNINDFKTVIDKKCAQWLNDTKMDRYLRPETLFGTKFEGYLNETVDIGEKPLPDWYGITETTPADEDLLKEAMDLQKKGLKEDKND